MSIKIWEAYRLRAEFNDRLWEVLHDVRVTAETNARQKLEKLYAQLVWTYIHRGVPEPLKEEWQKRKSAADFDENADMLFLASRAIRQGYKSQLGSFEKDFFDLDAWLSVRFYNGVYSFLPGKGHIFRTTFDFLRTDERFADWHYQNQTDRDEGISDEEWEQRRKYYEELDDKDRWRDSLHLIICDWQSFSSLDPYLDLLSAYYKEKRKRTEG